MWDALPEGRDAFSGAVRRRFGVHLLGLGVPKATGLYLARWVKCCLEARKVLKTRPEQAILDLG